MIYYDSRHLSGRLNINLAKWKRWAREFLDPDPLGGMQSGVARQFNVRDAFKVYLGGFLVSDLRFTIPEAMRILADLSDWLRENGFLDFETQLRSSGRNNLQEHRIYIYAMRPDRFAYAVRTLAAKMPVENDPETRTEIFKLLLIGASEDPLSTGDCSRAEIIAITNLYRLFRDKID